MQLGAEQFKILLMADMKEIQDSLDDWLASSLS